MKTLLAILLCVPLSAMATGGTVPPPVPVQKVKNINKSTNQSTAVDVKAAAETKIDQQLSAQGGAVSIQSDTRTAYAPDVISYPTAPCRVAVGGSAGWFGGAVGVTGSVLDENCEIMEISRRFEAMGNKAAATQVMCLSDKARQALEATGTVCKLKAEVQAETRVTP